MSDDYRVVSGHAETLDDGRMAEVGAVVSRADLVDDQDQITPFNQALIDDRKLAPIESPREPTLEELKARASELEIEGRSKMDGPQLKRAVAKAEADAANQTDASEEAAA